MRRTLLISFVLAALSVGAAYGSPDLSAKRHQSTASATSSHRKARHPANHAAGRESRHPAAPAVSGKHTRGTGAHRASSRQNFRSRKVADYPIFTKFRQSRATAPAIRPAEINAVSLRIARVDQLPPLRGSLQSLVRQNEKTEADGLERIEDDDDLDDRIARGMLVPVPVSATLTVNGNLPGNRRYCRPWTAAFLSDLARAHAAQFHGPLEVSSAVRTVAYQKQLERVNGNAAAAEGDIASPHLTGASIDIPKQNMSRQEIGWMRAWLLPLEEAGRIDVEEEFQQSCFHITVYKSYVPPKPRLKPAAEAKAAPAETAPSQAGKNKAGKTNTERQKPTGRKPEQPRQPPRPSVAPAEAPAEAPVEGQ